MKKTFFNNSTRGGDLQPPPKTKRKVFRTFGFASLALLMGAAGVFAFAPLGTTTTPIANANEIIESTTTSGLGLDPKKDPIVYTTDSGLEIKMSNAFAISKGGTVTTRTNTNYTYTQDLSSFYYFTMGTYSGTIYTAASRTSTYSVSSEPVNWIILGLGTNTGYFFDTVAQNLFSTWKTNIEGVEHSNTTSNNYFFKEIYETVSPAGHAIYSELATKAYIMDKVKASITTNSEIPEGCMLVLSEKILGQMYFNGSGAVNESLYTGYAPSYCVHANKWYGARYRYIGNYDLSTTGTQTWTISGNAGGSLYNYINNLFSKNTSGTILKNALGFTQTESDLIIPQQLYTAYYNGSSWLQETPSTDGGTYYTMFPLAYRTTNTSIKQNFCIEDYMPNQNQRVASLIKSNQSYFWFLRSGGPTSYDVYFLYPSGAYDYNFSSINDSFGARPAMVMKLK